MDNFDPTKHFFANGWKGKNFLSFFLLEKSSEDGEYLLHIYRMHLELYHDSINDDSSGNFNEEAFSLRIS